MSSTIPNSTFPCFQVQQSNNSNKTRRFSNSLVFPSQSYLCFPCNPTLRRPTTYTLICSTTNGPGAPGENENRKVLDAFFLGKAVAEALNERIESTIGEFLSAVGRLQAEQQKQVLDFQEEVLERAKRAKEKAARETMEAQGRIPKSTTASTTSITNGAVTKASPSPANDRISENSSSYNPSISVTDADSGSAIQE